jgi:hypothetical protein
LPTLSGARSFSRCITQIVADTAAITRAALLEAVAVGDLTPAEASELGKLIEAYIKALEATDFAEQLDKLERMTNR